MKSPIRLMTIKSTGLRNVGKVFLWVVLAFLLFKGVAGILDNRGQEDILKTIDEYRIAAEQREAARSGAAAFAENFIYEYYTFDGKYNTGYDERVAPYLAGSMNIAKPMGNGAETNVLSAKTTKISFASENRMDIDVSAKIQYIMDAANTSDGAIQIQRKDLNIRVPVAYKDGRFAVDASPIFVPQEDAADVEGATAYNGLEVSQQEKAELRQVLESFLKTYYGGSDQEVSYYVSEDSQIKHGLTGAFTFTSLKRMTAYTEDTGKYLVNAVVSVNDNGQEIEQNMYIYLSKAGDKIYIEQITTRVR